MATFKKKSVKVLCGPLAPGVWGLIVSLEMSLKRIFDRTVILLCMSTVTLKMYLTSDMC